MERDNPGDVIRHNLVALELGTDNKPVFMDSVGCPRVVDTPSLPGQCDNWTVTEPVIDSAESFDQWYRTVEGINLEFQKTLELVDQGGGRYAFDSTSFFPLDSAEGFGVAPTPDHHLGENFLFTTEIHVRFQYEAGQVFTFRGDDDLWIFVNGRLAMDLGSMHAAEEGTIDFDAQAGDLGISVGRSYPMDIFHAERHSLESNFRLETNISCFEPVVIK
jgi:fibro-slime domain-containing protein